MPAKMFIDSEWVDSSDGNLSSVYNPATGQVIEKTPVASRSDVGRAVDAARSTFDSGGWSRLTPADRSNTMLKVATMLEERSDYFASLETRNTGKSIKQTANYDVPYTIDNIRFLSGAARVIDGIASGEYVPDGTSIIRREPLGVVAAILPWNYPLMMVAWRAFPALLTGNTVVVKPASHTPLTALAIAELVVKAGVPKGVFNIVTGPGNTVGETLASHPSVDALAFTGSTEVGRRLSGLAAPTLKKVSLELGGKAPFIVMDDSDIEAATEGAVVGGLVNNGQDCANSTRYYVHDSVMDKFQSGLIDKLGKVAIGNPEDPNVDMGPLISSAHLERVKGYIETGLYQGGQLRFGGSSPKVRGFENGFYLQPTVIETDRNDSVIIKEEIFGPVYSLMKIRTMEEAIEFSNDVIYGLGASVWTKDITKAMRAVRDLRFGTVWVNEHVPVPSEMPWPAWKQSGQGASMSKYCLEEFTNLKHVYFDLTGLARKSWYYQIYGPKS